MAAPAVSSAAKREWLNTPGPLWEELNWLWEQNELRYEGGHKVLDELWRFDWETLPYSRTRSQLKDGVTIPNADHPTWSKTRPGLIPFDEQC